jgi:hypothetical protein
MGNSACPSADVPPHQDGAARLLHPQRPHAILAQSPPAPGQRSDLGSAAVGLLDNPWVRLHSMMRVTYLPDWQAWTQHSRPVHKLLANVIPGV